MSYRFDGQNMMPEFSFWRELSL